MAAILGIDLGASALRVAAESADAHAPLLLMAPMPPVWHMADDEKSVSAPKHELLSVKELLDFDVSLTIPPAGKNSIDFLSEQLALLRQRCKPELKTDELNAVVAVPPGATQRQRSAIRTAATRAGIARVRLVDDTLAALFQSLDLLPSARHVLVCAWGASTCSTVLYRLAGGRSEAVAQRVDSTLGGHRLDAAIAAYVFGELRRLGVVGRLLDAQPLLGRIELWAMGAKAKLAAGESATVTAEVLGEYAAAGVVCAPEIYQAPLREMITRVAAMTADVLRDGQGIQPDALLLSGGMLNISSARQALEREGVRIVSSTDNAVAKGALLFGQRLTVEDWEQAAQRGTPRLTPAPAPAPTPVPEPRACAPKQTWAGLFSPGLDKAQQEEESGRTESALVTIDGVLKELVDFSGELQRRQAARLRGANQPEQSRHLLEIAHHRNPGNRMVAVDFAEACYQDGSAAYGCKQSEKALQLARAGAVAIEDLAKREANYAERLARLYHLECLACCSLHLLDEARIAITKATQLKPGEPRYREVLDQVLAASKNSPQRSNKIVGLFKGSDRNQPCACGSGKKYKKCHGK